MQLTATQQKTLGLARDIISGEGNIGAVENGLTVSDTIHHSSIRSVFKNDAATLAFGVVRILVDRFLGSFGFSTKHTSDQVDIITVDILDNFKYESLEDIIVFLKMARTGKFGTSHRGIDSNLVIGDWMPKYLEMKAEAREKYHINNKHEMLKVDVSTEAILRGEQKNLEKKKHAAAQNAFREYVENITKGITREQLEILIEKCSQVKEAAPHIWILKMKRREIK